MSLPLHMNRNIQQYPLEFLFIVKQELGYAINGVVAIFSHTISLIHIEFHISPVKG